MNFEVCQNDTIRSASGQVFPVWVWLAQLRHRMKTHGTLPAFRIALHRAVEALGVRTKPKTSGMVQAVAPKPQVDEVLGLHPGDWVEVKSLAEIRSTLDAKGCHRGLDFTEEMLEYCGRRFRVFKRVERICMEGNSSEMRTLKNTVSLEGAICNGGSRGCDRGCMMFWREAWLKRAQ